MATPFPPGSSTLRSDQLGEIAWEAIGSPSAAELNANISQPLEIGVSVYTFFNENQLVTPFLPYMGASNGVDLYRLYYRTIVPETGAEESVSGLLAIPQLRDRPALPMVSWQHGTIFESDDAPSCIYQDGKLHLDPHGVPRSIETLLNVVALAGNGYIVAAADYVGNGWSQGTQAYACKDATVQVMKDMLLASRCMLQHLGISSEQLFLYGWSQGGLNTQWLAWALQESHASGSRDIPLPTRVAAVSSPTNLARLCRYWMNSYAGKPSWLTPVVPILFGSYQTYYGIDGLMEQAIRPDYLEIAYRIYNKQFDWTAVNWLLPTPICIADPQVGSQVCLPVRPIDMLNPEFLSEFNQDHGAFHALTKAHTALQGRFAMPCRFYGGASDAVIPQWSSITLPEEHQRLQGSLLTTGVAVDAGVPMGEERAGKAGATHRSTFLASLFDPGLNVRQWFDEAL